jgi:hypothetical protein
MYYYKKTGCKQVKGNSIVFDYSPFIAQQLLQAVLDITQDNVVFTTEVNYANTDTLTAITEQIYNDTAKAYSAAQPIVTPTPSIEQQITDMKTLNAQMLSALVANGII